MTGPFEVPDAGCAVTAQPSGNQRSLSPAVIAAPEGAVVKNEPGLHRQPPGRYPKDMEPTVRQPRMDEESTTRFPLTFQQQDPDRTERHSKLVIPTAWRIKGKLEIDALRGAFDDVVERHESLRTRIHYSETDDGPEYQEVLPPLPVPFTVHAAPMVAGRSRDEVALDLYVKVNEERLDFFVTPSLRVDLYLFDDHDAVLTFLTHHLYSDNWSIGVLRREVVACYHARVNGVPPALDPPVQYRQYSAWQREFLRSEGAKAARRFWLDKLSGAEMFTLPADRPRNPDTMTARSKVRTFHIDLGDSARIKASAARYRCTAWHLFLTAGMILAEGICGSADITLLAMENGRNIRDFYGTVGFFVNPVPLCLRFDSCTTFKDLMLLARKESSAIQRNGIPFREVITLAPGLMRSFQDPQAMPFALNYVRPFAALAELQFADRVEPIAPQDVPSMYHRGVCSWDVEMLPSGAFRCVIEYEPSMVDADTIEHWGVRFIDLVLAIAARPEQVWRSR